jgi:hypothetical protein
MLFAFDEICCSFARGAEFIKLRIGLAITFYDGNEASFGRQAGTHVYPPAQWVFIGPGPIHFNAIASRIFASFFPA